MDTARTRALRSCLVDDLKAEGHIRSAAVERAMREVPRHTFIPWCAPDETYRSTAGAIVDPATTPETHSTVSQPAVVALMLEALEPTPGMRVLEIGAGSGYNAALLAHIVGSSGQVVTVDLEDFLVEKARRQLTATGFERVHVVCGDGALGHAPGAPYDRIVATVGLWDIPPAWREQLAPEGRIVVPLHLAGKPSDHELVTLGRKGDHLEGVGVASLQMVLFRGAAARYGEKIQGRCGSAWQGARVDELRLRIYPQGAEIPLEPQQKHLEKSGSITVLERLETTPLQR